MTPQLGRVGLWSAELRTAPGRASADAAKELDDAGWGALWIPGAAGPGIHDSAEHLLEATTGLTVALGVMSRWSPDAGHAAERHAQLTDRYGHRFLTGIGISNEHAAHAAGHTLGKPLAAMRQYLDELAVAPIPLPPDQRVLAALGPKMIGLAKERAAGVHPFLVTPEWTASARAILGPGPLIAAHQAVVLDSDPTSARAIARDGIGMFLGFPAYQGNLRRLGFDDEDLVPGGGDKVIDATVAWGDTAKIAERVRAHHDAGADHVAVHVLTARRELPVIEWRALVPLLD